jgi:hypothetical protein
MAKYLLSYRGGGMPATEKEQAKVMAAWNKWYTKLGAAIVDGGNPIGQSQLITATGDVKKAGKSAISGYTIIEAKSIDAAVKLAKGCPIIKSGGTVEVGETYDVM